ncbi:Large repetitive protein [hydrothermal vent metagenome]|uniref:Large repetitive protein n=1 Tax=hydrothermal vent metagenome TaxID=652676 RepID=A0A1W1CF83_9ZZZZ
MALGNYTLRIGNNTFAKASSASDFYSGRDINFAIVDTIPPNFVDYTVSGNQITLNFDEPIAKGSGNIITRDINGNQLDFVLGTFIQVSGSQATFNAPQLIGQTAPGNYTIEIPNTLFTDTAGNAYTGGNVIYNIPDTTAPVVNSTTPASGANLTGNTIRITFDETIQLTSGAAVGFTDNSGNTQQLTNIAVSGSNADITIPANIAVGAVSLNVGANVFSDRSNNFYAGNTFNFTFQDTVDPTLVSSTITPQVDINVRKFVFTFSENVQLGSGDIVLTPAGGTAITANAADININGPVVTWNLPSALVLGNYTLNGQNNAILDTSGNAYAGNNFSFTVADFAAPVITQFVIPTVDDTRNNTFSLSFNEDIVVGSGNIVFYNQANNSAIYTVPITDPSISADGNRKLDIVVPSSTFDDSTATIRNYYILINSGIVSDASNNAFIGIVDRTKYVLTINSVVNANATPFTKELKSFVKSTVITSLVNLKNNLSTMYGRISFLHRSKDESQRAQFNGINVSFKNKDLNLLNRAYSFNKYLNLANNKVVLGSWNSWVKGNVIVGDISSDGANIDVSGNGLTYGLDKQIDKKLTLGFSFNYNTTETKDSSFSTDGKYETVSSYGSYELGDNAYIDGVFAFTRISNKHKRDSNKGKQSGSQKVMSLLYGKEYKKDGLYISPFARYTYANTILEGYQESGNNNPLGYDDISFNSSSLGLGINIDKSFAYKDGVIKPYSKLEYSNKLDNDFDSKVYYIATPNNKFNEKLDGTSSNSWLMTIGMDYEHKDSNLSLGYTRAQTENLDEISDNYSIVYKLIF